MSLRPTTIDDYIGQEHIKEILLTSINAAKIRGEPLDHILLTGPAGLGKTTLAQVIANEMNSECRIINAAEVDDVSGIKRIIQSIQPHDVIFIDEIHRLNKASEEYLYHPMEDGVIYDEKDEYIKTKTKAYPEYCVPSWDITVPTGNKIRVEIEINPFTLIGATTNSGGITKPLRDRFQIQFTLTPYTTSELTIMAKQKARMLDIGIEDDAAEDVAKRSRGVARVCVNYIKRCRDYAQVNGHDSINMDVTRDVFRMLRVDPIGLTYQDITYLHVLLEGWGGDKVRAFGIKTLAAMTGEDTQVIEEVIEPYLAQIGFIDRTPRGRAITERAVRYLSEDR